MPDRSSAGRPAGPHPLPGTPALALGAAALCALAWAVLTFGAPREARGWVQSVSIGYGVLLVAAVIWAGGASHRRHRTAERLAAADSRNTDLRRKATQAEAFADGHQRQLARMAADADAVAAELAAARAETEQLRVRLEAAAADTGLLADTALPRMVELLGSGASAATALAAAPALADPRHRRVLEVFTGELAGGARLRAATLAACANAAGRVQALTTTMMADLREMENRYDEDVLGDLLKLDHATAQAGRLADSIAVLTGGRSGRRWTKPIVMESILRGAIGRISAYQRVRLHSTSTAAVVGHAAEGVMHALAELVDNATRFSPPTETVHLYVEELTTGVVITVEDAGLVMSPPALRRAQHAVSHDPLRLGTLSGTRLGLAVVGGIAGKYGLTVNFRPSSRGGTGVLLLIPQHLITRPREETPAHGTPREPAERERDRDRGAPRTAVPAATGPAASGEPVIGPSGLPMRQPGHTAPAAPLPVPAPAAPAEGTAWSSHPSAGPDTGPETGPVTGRETATSTAGTFRHAPEPVPRSRTVPAPAVPAAADDDLLALPKRVRGHTLAAAEHAPPGQGRPGRDEPAPQPATGNMGARFGAFVAAGKRRREQTARTRAAEPQQPAGPQPAEPRPAEPQHAKPQDDPHDMPHGAPHDAPQDDTPSP
jgi:signal transduction histidine kinase